MLAVQPGGDAELTEDVATAETHRRGVVVVADRARVAGRQQLLAGGLGAQVLENIKCINNLISQSSISISS